MKKSWPVLIFLVLIESLGYATLARADGVEELNRLLGPKTEGAAGMVLTAPVAGSVLIRPDTGIIHLTPNKTQIIRLDQDASSVIVTNPVHADIALDSPRLLVLMPRLPGATSFTVLNARGEMILQKDVVVSATQPHYVRVRRICGAQDAACAPSAYYYCPDGCYEMAPVAPGSGQNAVPEIAGGSAPAFNNTPVIGSPPPPMINTIDNEEESEEPAGDEGEE